MTTRFYKIPKSTQTYQTLQDMFAKIAAANKVARDLAIELGSETSEMISNSSYVSGGIIGFHMNKQPEGWRKAAGKKFPDFYYPKSNKANKALLERIAALPKIYRSDLSRLVGYGSVWGAPGIIDKGEFMIVVAPVGGFNGEIKPTADMVEILGSEYTELAKLEDQSISAK